MSLSAIHAEIATSRYTRDTPVLQTIILHRASSIHVSNELTIHAPMLTLPLNVTMRGAKPTNRVKIRGDKLRIEAGNSDSPSGNSSSCTGRGSSHDFRALFPLYWPHGSNGSRAAESISCFTCGRAPMQSYTYHRRCKTSAIVSAARSGLRDATWM